MNRFLVGLCAFAMATTAYVVVPASASACGGFFCNRQPIDQSGENIVFAVQEDGTMETHVQILYQGTAEEFAWILPVPTLPEVGVGTDALFQQIRQATNPTFPLDREVTGTCRPTPSCPSDGLLWEGDDRAGAGSGDAAAAPPSDPGVEVLLQEAVGPYDAVVLSAGDADALFAWLTDNGYDIPEASVPLLMEYIEEGSFFLALKLQQDRGTGEIQPVVLRYTERKPCVPIKLTAIATVPDMPITAYILGDRRARPSNYMATEPDLDHPGFWLGGESYPNAVSRAVDEAGGQAFVTDFAGQTPELFLAIETIEDLREETDPGQFMMRLQERGFLGDTQLLAILVRFIPPPDGATPQQFYNCLTNGCVGVYDAYVDSLDFDPNALVDALNEAIVEPRQNAQDLVEAHAQLTRLFTTMSAEEMTLDPLFDLDEDVPEVDNVHRATHLTECSPEYFQFHAPQKLILPSGAEHVIQEGIAYPGSDEAYCEDRAGNMYGPYVDVERARATAARRGIELGGGGGCSASGGAGGLGLALLLGFGVLFASRRRK
jgi:hypothetical protein